MPHQPFQGVLAYINALKAYSDTFKLTTKSILHLSESKCKDLQHKYECFENKILQRRTKQLEGERMHEDV